MPNNRVLFLPGLGQTPEVWVPIISQLPGINAVTPALFGDSSANSSPTLTALTDSVAETLKEPAHAIGLSVGALVALDLAARYPHLVRSVYASAPAVNPPKAALRFQKLVMKILPARLTVPEGLTKIQLLALVDSLSSANLLPQLPSITAPTTIACGTRDKPNLGSAREAAAAIPGAHLELVEGASHTWNTDRPALFARSVEEHLTRAEGAARHGTNPA